MAHVALRDPIVIAAPRIGAGRYTPSHPLTPWAAFVPRAHLRRPPARVHREARASHPTPGAQERAPDPRG